MLLFWSFSNHRLFFKKLLFQNNQFIQEYLRWRLNFSHVQGNCKDFKMKIEYDFLISHFYITLWAMF